MLSKPLAFGLVAAACVAAAGGGAYIATLQHARNDSALAAQREPTHAQQAPAVPAPAATSPAAGQDRAAQVSVAELPAQPAPETPAPSTARSSPSGPVKPAPQPAAVPKTAPRTTPVQAPKEAEPAPAPAAPDPASQAQKPETVPQIPAPVPAPADAAVKDEPREPQRVWEELTVPADSVIGLQLESPLSSESARVEDRVDARVTRDVRVNGRVAIPAGTHAIGSVILVERGGKIKDRARLGIRFNTLVLPDDTRASISTETVYREGEPPSTRSSAKIGGAAIGGAIIGAILGGGKGAAIGTGIGAAGGTAAAMAGDRQAVTLPVGTPLSVRTQSPITVTIEK